MKHFVKVMFCFFLTAQSMLHGSQNSNIQKILDNPTQAIALYFAVKIHPWHYAARQAVTDFNKQYPDKKLKEKEHNKLYNIYFESKHPQQNIELKVKQQPHLDAFRACLQGPTFNKEHSSLTPETLRVAIYNMLINHVK